MQGQTVASINAAAGKPKEAPTPKRPGEQLEVSITFVLPLEAGHSSNFQEIYEDFANRLSTATTGYRLIGGSSYERRHPGWFLTKIVHRVGRRVNLGYDYARPGAPRR